MLRSQAHPRKTLSSEVREELRIREGGCLSSPQVFKHRGDCAGVNFISQASHLLHRRRHSKLTLWSQIPVPVPPTTVLSTSKTFKTPTIISTLSDGKRDKYHEITIEGRLLIKKDIEAIPNVFISMYSCKVLGNFCTHKKYCILKSSRYFSCQKMAIQSSYLLRRPSKLK